MENQSQDPRWINPAIVQNSEMLNQIDAGHQADAMQGIAPPEDQADPDYQKMMDIRNALVFIKQMKQKGVENRSPQEQSKYKAAVQILAKNPDLIQKMGLPAGVGQENDGAQ